MICVLTWETMSVVVGYEEEFTLTAHVQNLGPEDATGVFVTAPLTNDATFVVTGSSQECALGTDGSVICNASGTLAEGGTIQFTVKLRAPNKSTTVVSKATVSSDNPQWETDPSNNSATDSVIVRPADLALDVLTDAPDPIGLEEPLTYTATIKNLGPGSVRDPKMNLTLPSADMVFDASNSDSRCALAGTGSQVVLCKVGDDSPSNPVTLGANASASFTITASAPKTSQELTTTAMTVWADDPKPENNAKSVKTLVGYHDLEVIGIDVISPTAPGVPAINRNMTVRATLKNQTAKVAAKNVRFTYVSASSGTPDDSVAAKIVSLTGGHGATCDPTAKPVQCTFADIPGGRQRNDGCDPLGDPPRRANPHGGCGPDHDQGIRPR